MSDWARYGRQMLLPDIGEAGQRMLGAAEAKVSGPGLAHEIATAYARRAGMGLIRQGVVDEGSLAPAFLENPAARAVVAGARAALFAMRAALSRGAVSQDR